MKVVFLVLLVLQLALAQSLSDVGLKDIYANHFRIGNILNGTTVNNTGIKTMILKEYNSITAENEMKPDATMNRTGSTNTDIKVQLNTGARAILKFCSDNNIPVRGHVLTWHGQTPDWFFLENVQDQNWQSYRNGLVSQVPWATPEVMNQRLESYIKNLFELIKKDFPNVYLYAYDVVNEAVAGEGGMRPGGFNFDGAGGQGSSNAGDSPWQAVYGANSTTWIKNAFTYARKYAPAHTKLFYNDYNEWAENKRDYIINSILKPLHNDGLLDGMGMQTHIDADPGQYAWSRLSRYKEAMDKYGALGIEVQITEMDISAGANREWLDLQPERYKQIFEYAITVNSRGAGKFTAICIWGPNDANTWISGDKRPTLYDASNNKKPAYDAVAAVVPKSNWGDGNNPGFVGSSSSTGGSSSSSNIDVTCNINNLEPSYTGCNDIPRPNVICSSGESGAATFSVGGSAISGWNAAGGTHPFCNPGSRAVTLSSVVCGSTTVTLAPAISCGSFEIISEPSSSSSENTTALPTSHLPLVTSQIPEYYNLKGKKVSGTLPSGVYIEKKQGMPSKIFVVR